jgi:hypothetical protein
MKTTVKYAVRHALYWWALLTLASIVVVSTASAADVTPTTTVVIPWGSWLTSLLASLGTIAVSLIAFAVNKWAPATVKPFVTDALITKAVNYGLAAIEGAVAGQTLTLSTTNQVLAAAENFALVAEPTVAKWIGDNLRPLLLSKLSELGVVPAEATAASTRTPIVAKG